MADDQGPRKDDRPDDEHRDAPGERQGDANQGQHEQGRDDAGTLGGDAPVPSEPTGPTGPPGPTGPSMPSVPSDPSGLFGADSPFGLPLRRPGAGGELPTGDLSAMLEHVLGEAAGNPELAEAMRSMGVDLTDPATQAAMRAQLGSFMAAQDSPTGSRDLATDVARKHVSAAEGNDVHDEAASRAVVDAVAVASLWLDEQTTLSTPAWRATGLSRAEWVEATMPRWFELIEPVSDGVTAATSEALRKQVGELGPEAFGDALPPGLPEGFDPRAMVDQWAPMLGNLSRQMFSAQLGQAVGTLATEVVGGTEVGLPLTEPGLVALLPGNVAALADSLEIDIAQVRLYLAVREAARIRLFAEVPWLGPQLLSAVSDYARNITIDTDAIESALSTIDPSDPEALRAALQGNLFRPQPTTAQQAALDRLETLLALAEGWVDHVTDRATARHLPQSAALAETIRRRRVGGAAQKTFAGLVGLELRPRRLRDAANLWAALESAGGAELRDGRWAHPDLAPTSADLDDPIGYVERVQGGPAAVAGGPTGSGELGDLDAVLRGILEDADRERRGGASDASDASDASRRARRRARPDAVTAARHTGPGFERDADGRPAVEGAVDDAGDAAVDAVDDAWLRLRDDAVARLEAWAAPDAAQDRLRTEFLAHLAAHPDAMSKQGPPAHLTGSVVVLDADGRSTLLTHHRRALAWFQLGGHYEAGDASVWHAARREATEESGIDGLTVLPGIVQLDRHELVGDFGTCREHLDVRFVAVVPPGSRARVSDESLDVRWWPVDDLPEGTRDELRPLVEAGLRALRR